MGYGDFGGGGSPLDLLGSLFGGGGGPSASTSQTSNIVNNPNVRQGALSNSVILGPQVGGAGGSAASGGGLFGLFGGGASGGAGGSNSAYVDQHNTTMLASNPPPPLQEPGAPNLLQGSAFANQLQTPQGPMFAGNGTAQSPIGSLLASMPQPIASGGYFPIVQSPLNQPSSGGGESVAPGYSSPPVFTGSAQQAGGYQSPPPAPPQQLSQASMRQALSPQVMSLGGQPKLVAPPAPYDASGAVAKYPQLQSEQGQLDATPTALEAGTGESVTPSQPYDATLTDFNGQLEKLKQQVPKVAHGAIDAFGKQTEKLLREHQRMSEPLREELKGYEGELENVRQDMKSLSNPKEMERKVQDAKQAIYDNKSPAQKAAIDRIENGTSGVASNSQHPKLDMLGSIARHVGRAMQASMGEQGLVITELQDDQNRRHLKQEASKAQHASDQHEYDEFTKEINQNVAHGLTAANSNLDATKSMVVDKRQQLNHLDQQLKTGVDMAKEMTFGPANEYLKSLSEQAQLIDKEASNYTRGVNINNQGISQRQRERGLDIAQQNANKGEAAFNLSKERYEGEKGKLKADLEKNEEQTKRLKAGFPSGVPKRAKDQDLEKYRVGLYEGYKNGQWSKEDATKAFFYEQAKGD